MRRSALSIVAESLGIELDRLREHQRRFAIGFGNSVFEIP